MEGTGAGIAYARVRLDCGTTSESIDRLLDEKMYPIVKVKRKSGAVHWIMLTGTEKDTLDITAMDPIDGFVHMSDYDNRIYGIRVVTGSGKSLETTGDETEASGKPDEFPVPCLDRDRIKPVNRGQGYQPQ